MPATVAHSFPIHRAGQAATLRASVWSFVIHASVGFRVAYRAIPQSLMEKLEAFGWRSAPGHQETVGKSENWIAVRLVYFSKLAVVGVASIGSHRSYLIVHKEL